MSRSAHGRSPASWKRMTSRSRIGAFRHGSGRKADRAREPESGGSVGSAEWWKKEATFLGSARRRMRLPQRRHVSTSVLLRALAIRLVQLLESGGQGLLHDDLR